MLTDKQRQVIDLRDREGLTWDQIAKRTGRDQRNLRKSYKAAKGKLAEKQARLDPGVHQLLGKFGMGETAGLHSGWVHKEDKETGEWVSTYFFLGKDGQPSEADLETIMASAIKKVFTGDLAKPARPAPSGENLLVIDIADLHIGKLCVQSETGFHYDRAEAVRRGIEGCRQLAEWGKLNGIARILFVIGNDIIHIDRPDRRTTAGTGQDTDGTIHVMWDDALAFYVACIDLLRQYAPVDVIHCPSNHDWFAGFTLARSIRAWYRDCPEVSATEYGTSEIHRKYYRFENNLIGLTHADGAKENDLHALMMAEVPEHIERGVLLYWYLHHLHHKIRKQGANKDRRMTEKDLIGMTVIHNKAGIEAPAQSQIEYVRSASAPDGWHHRNGYVNRQAVEAYLHHPHDGQCGRWSVWF